jgi:Ca2+-binding EF-hand superfamily protein
MLKPIFAAALVMVAAPSFAQDATLPPCSAKVTDRCQQTTRQEASALTAAQAEKKGKFAGSPSGMESAPPTLDQRLAREAAMIKKLDKDGDGKISKAEWLAGGRKAAVFDTLDANGDGYVDAAELKAGGDAIRAARDEFVAADTNKDGKWSRDEWKAAGFDERVFDKLDTNKDGFVTRAELHAGAQKAKRKIAAAKAQQ